ncbi:uncharacterized protein LOC111044564 [Nilaparvata lugens]|uniref:uncharacterized protein LOC111044564 n=1 Tax=Nilaparvata lugens TaxID=108931 RepID=UPI00193D4C54|nr:uncharacterized protein LOC111044564 [Nilaparvata lugens]
MDKKALHLLAVLSCLFSLGQSSNLANIYVPCKSLRITPRLKTVMDFVCYGKSSPDLEPILSESVIRRGKRDSKLLNALISSSSSLDTLQMEQHWDISSNGEEELPIASKNGSDEKVLLDRSQISSLKQESNDGGRRMKRANKSENPDLMEKIIDCCDYYHRVGTTCTLRDLRRYCDSYSNNGNDNGDKV